MNKIMRNNNLFGIPPRLAERNDFLQCTYHQASSSFFLLGESERIGMWIAKRYRLHREVEKRKRSALPTRRNETLYISTHTMIIIKMHSASKIQPGIGFTFSGTILAWDRNYINVCTVQQRSCFLRIKTALFYPKGNANKYLHIGKSATFPPRNLWAAKVSSRPSPWLSS